MDNQRLDKWLWCARFLKTRSLAHDAINSGRVSVNGLRAKPAKSVAVGDEVIVKAPPFEYVIKILGFTPQRLAAPLARGLYVETPASIQAREQLSEALRLGAVHEERTAGKIDKRDRRAREALKRDSWQVEP